MLLVIENKDDPTGQIAEELDDTGGAELAYIPVITVPLGCDTQQAKYRFAVDRMSFEHRKVQEENNDFAPQPEKLVPLYLKAVSHIGQRPAYLSSPDTANLEIELPESRLKLYTQG